MTNVFIVGFNGNMGQAVFKATQKRFPDWFSYSGFARTPSRHRLLYTSIEQLMLDASTIRKSTDVIIDFSHPSATMEFLPFAVETKLPMVIGTTGFTAKQEEELKNCSKIIPIFKSDNQLLLNREIIAQNALNAAKFIIEQPKPGLYSIDDLQAT